MILIVDDEQPVRRVLGLVMHEAGYRTTEAKHGADALTLIAEDRPDLVIADMMMPVLDGAELCRRLKASPSTSSIPVILMSAAGRRLADGTGADAFIAKPFDLDAIEALVRHWRPITPEVPRASCI